MSWPGIIWPKPFWPRRPSWTGRFTCAPRRASTPSDSKHAGPDPQRGLLSCPTNGKSSRLSRMARTRLVCWGLVLVTFVLFAQVRSHEFVEYDDPDYVTENQHVKNGFTKEGLAW